MGGQALISIRDLSRYFRQRQGLTGRQQTVRAVHELSLDIAQGETLGVVGESGCGKSTLGRMCVTLLPPSSGDVFINGLPLYDKTAHADYRAFRRALAGQIQMVFQDPYSSLNPRMRIGDSVAEPLVCSPAPMDEKKAVAERVSLMLRQVGMDADAARRYPHEFSGGQRQRVAIARALITRPAFVVCDEPTSSLDASVQSQVLNLLRDMQDELGLTYMFISHDLAVIRHMSDRVAVMYRGLLVEEGSTEAVLSLPLHPYTRLLLDSVPGAASADTYFKPAMRTAATRTNLKITDTPQDELSPGCPFAPRCPEAMPGCALHMPQLQSRKAGRVRCFLYEDSQ
jgi:oligopeptide/dipeptide ABC transporter, ATP-binding protein, C-terminal domain